MPDVVDARGDVPFCSAVGNKHGGGVDNGAEVAQDVRFPGADGRLKQPAQAAAGERLDLGG